MIVYQPFVSRLLNRLEIFNEGCILLLSYLMWEFSDFTSDSRLRYDLGWVYTFILVLNISTNMIMTMIFGSIIPAFKKIRRKVKVKKQKRVNPMTDEMKKKQRRVDMKKSLGLTSMGNLTVDIDNESLLKSHKQRGKDMTDSMISGSFVQ
jgi:hypothetical protein